MIIAVVPREFPPLDSLEEVVPMVRIPVDPRLSHLRVLHFGIDYHVGLEDLGVTITDLKSLAHLENLILPIRGSSFLRDLVACPKLANYVSGLQLVNL